MKQYIYVMFALMGLLLVGSAFASVDTAATVQATQLQLHIDKALTVGANVIVKIEANNTNSTTNVSIAQLQTILDQLLTIRNSINVNSSTIDSVQATRKQVMDLVTTFKQTAGPLLGDAAKADALNKAEKEFNNKHGQKMMMGLEMMKRFNLNSLEGYAEAQQHSALNLSADENVSLTPEFAAKIADIRARIETNQVTRDEIAQIRTQIKAGAEELKGNRDMLVATIREDVLQQRVEMLEEVITYAQAKNISTTQLESVHTQLLALLDSYDAGNMSAKDFAQQANVLHDLAASAVENAGLGKLKDLFASSMKNDRVQITNETKAQKDAWHLERKTMMDQIKALRDGMRGNYGNSNGNNAQLNVDNSANQNQQQEALPSIPSKPPRNERGNEDANDGGSDNANEGGN